MILQDNKIIIGLHLAIQYKNFAISSLFTVAVCPDNFDLEFEIILLMFCVMFTVYKKKQ